MDQKEKFRGEEFQNNFMWLLVYNWLCIFFQQGAKLKVQNLKDPPFVTKLDPIIGSDGYDMEGPIPDIWFALQVGSITIDTFESI